MLVLLYHLTPGHDSNRGLASLAFKIADLGWLGVDLFFVLSGFLITRIALEYRERGRPLRAFLRNRLLRIVPAYYLALAGVLVVAPLLFGLYPVPPAGTQLAFLLYVANLFAAETVLGGTFALGHFWSLSLEVQFYLLWPLALYRLPLAVAWRIAIGLLVAGPAVRVALVVAGAGWETTFAWTPLRLDALLLGSLAGMHLRHRPPHGPVLRAAPLVLAGAGFVLATAAWYGYGNAIFKAPDSATLVFYRSTLTSVGALFFAALLVLSLQPGLLARVLGSPPLRPLARYSYGLYVVHFLFVPLFETHLHPRRLVAWTGDADLAIWLYFAITSALSFGVAMVSFHLWEVHFLRRKSRA